MSLESIRVIVKELPTLIMYLIPGYLVLWVMSFLLSVKLENDKNIIIKSIVISYILITLSNLILGFWGLSVLESNLAIIVIMVLALLIGFISAKIVLSEWLSKFFRLIKVFKSIHFNFFNDIIDLKYGLWVTVYLPNDKMIYKGQIRKYEEKDNTEISFMVLSNYTQLNYASEVIVNNESNNNERVLINTKDASRIHLHYHPDSKKII